MLWLHFQFLESDELVGWAGQAEHGMDGIQKNSFSVDFRDFMETQTLLWISNMNFWQIFKVSFLSYWFFLLDGSERLMTFDEGWMLAEWFRGFVWWAGASSFQWGWVDNELSSQYFTYSVPWLRTKVIRRSCPLHDNELLGGHFGIKFVIEVVFP